jgi:dolichol-phosphate mannosyltransferase
MSGFFLVRRSAIDLGALRPRGFKILLEILLSGRELATSEVPFRFGERHAGQSKASFREAVRYVRRLLELRVSGRARRLVKFSAVGASGVAINTGALALLAGSLHVPYLLASVLATQVAIFSNFIMSEWFVFRGSHSDHSRRFRCVNYVLVCNASLALTVPLLALFVSVIGTGVLVANLLALSLVFALRFTIADAYLWGPRRLRSRFFRPALRARTALRAHPLRAKP